MSMNLLSCIGAAEESSSIPWQRALFCCLHSCVQSKMHRSSIYFSRVCRTIDLSFLRGESVQHTVWSVFVTGGRCYKLAVKGSSCCFLQWFYDFSKKIHIRKRGTSFNNEPYSARGCCSHTHTHLHNSQEKRKEGKPKGRAIVSVSLEGSSGPLPAADRKSHIVTHSPQTKRYLGFPEGNLRAQDTGSPRGAQASASISAGTIEPEYHSAQVRDTGPPCMVHKVIR